MFSASSTTAYHHHPQFSHHDHLAPPDGLYHRHLPSQVSIDDQLSSDFCYNPLQTGYPLPQVAYYQSSDPYAIDPEDIAPESKIPDAETLPEPPKQLTLEELRKIAKAEKRKRRRATLKYRTLHASRERVRVESFNKAFSELRALLPTMPKDKKLSKIEILRISIAYIQYLNDLLLLN